MTLVENFLRMTFGLRLSRTMCVPELVRALDMLFILHVDHEQNCSTSTVRLVGSSQANLFSVDLRRHQRAVGTAARRRQPGGAGDVEDARDGGDVQDFVKKVKDSEDDVKLMGFGDRVYRLRSAGSHRQGAGGQDPRQARRRRRIARYRKGLEEVALTDDFFVERKLYPNVDFYTGVIYRAMGFPMRDVHRAVRVGSLAGLDRTAGDARRGTARSAVRARSTRATPSATTSPSTAANFLWRERA